MRKAVIDAGGKVVNIIKAESDFNAGPDLQVVDVAQHAEIGAVWDGVVFLPVPKPVVLVPSEYESLMAQNPLVSALIKCVNEGSIVAGGNLSDAAIRVAMEAHL